MPITKMLSILLICFVAVSAASCINVSSNNHQASSPAATEKDKSTHDQTISGAPKFAIDTLNFTQSNGYLFPDSGGNISWWSDLSFYGEVSGRFSAISNDEITDKLNKFYKVPSIKTEQGDDIGISSANWLVSGSEDGKREFWLRLSCTQPIAEPTVIKSIAINQDGAQENYDTGEYTVHPTNYAQSKYGFVSENIIDLLDTASDDMIVDFRISVPQEHDERTLSFGVTISDNPNVLSAEVVGWSYDETATTDAKEFYSTTKTEKELQFFKIYAVNIRIVTKVKDVVVQPCFTASYNNNSYHVMTDPFHYTLD